MRRLQPHSFWRPYFVLVLSLALTACAAYYVADAAYEQDRLRFERMADRTRDAMTARLRTYIAALRGCAGLVHANNLQRFGGGTQPKQVSAYLIGREAFRNYVGQLRLQSDFPGIQGIGFTVRVPTGQKNEFLAKMRRANAGFRMWPTQKVQSGQEWHSILYLEPMDQRNRAAIGYNMYSEPTRRTAMQKAGDSGDAAASGKVLLKQEITPDKQSGFLIYIPVYRGSQVPRDRQARRTQLLGFVYSPFRAGDFLETLLDEPTQERLLFQLYDGLTPTQRNLLYQSATVPVGYRPAYNRTVTVRAAGRTWTLRVMTRPKFDHDSNAFLVPFIIVSGLIVSLLLFAVTWTQAVAYHRAEQTTQELKQSEVKRERLLASEHEARLQAEEANRAKDEFLAVVSHELRTPLTSILGWASLIRNSPFHEENLRLGLETIERNARAQSQLIEDLLDMSRVVSGRMRLDTEAVSLVPILDAALDAVRPAAQAKNIQLWRRYDALDATNARVLGDSDRLQQVVWNLLTNAIKFTPEDGRIELSLQHVKKDNKEIFEMSVKDNGIGMEPEFVLHAFERFRQADGTATRSHSGLGLGLSIVRHLVEMHGGEVHAYSEGQGLGSTFTVRLPVLAEAPAQGTLQNKLDASVERQADLQLENKNGLVEGRLRGKKVLVVEDEPDARRMIGAILQAHGAHVQAVNSVPAALQMLASWQPDILVSDIGLPGEDGYSLMRQVRALPLEEGGAIPALALTAFASANDRHRALDAGFQSYLAKPISPLQLAETVALLSGD